MRAIIAIAKDSLREMAKKKLLLAVLIASILTAIAFIAGIGIVGIIAKKMVQGSNANQASPELIGTLTNQGYSILVTCFSITIDLLGTFLAILSFATFLPSEIDRGTIKLIISKPVSRMEVVIGKFLGGAVMLAGYSILMGTMQIIGSIYLTEGLTFQELWGSFLPFFKFLMIGSVSMALSVVMRPILAGVVAFFLSGDIFSWLAIMSTSKFTKYPFLALYYILPTYSLFETRTLKNLLFSTPPLTAVDIIYKIGYALDFTIIILIITIILFNKKDLI